MTNSRPHLAVAVACGRNIGQRRSRAPRKTWAPVLIIGWKIDFGRYLPSYVGLHCRPARMRGSSALTLAAWTWPHWGGPHHTSRRPTPLGWAAIDRWKALFC